MATIQHISPPSVLLEKPSHENLPQSRPNSAVVDDEGLPEVVNSNYAMMKYHDAPIPVDSESDKRFNEAPIPIGTLDDYPPPLPARNSTTQYPYSPGSYASQHQSPYSTGGYAPQVLLQHPDNSGFTPQPPSYNSNEVVTYVTPLTELGDHPKFVDCPFCMHRAETRVKKTSSKVTQ
ncbi:hypothetical protein ACHAP8_002663 [Fusarium lateritium]